MPPDEALAELRSCAGSQFDAVVVDAFSVAVDAGSGRLADDARG